MQVKGEGSTVKLLTYDSITLQVSLTRCTTKEVFPLAIVIIMRNTKKYYLATNIFHQSRFLPTYSFTKGPDHCARARFAHRGFQILIRFALNTVHTATKCVTLTKGHKHPHFPNCR
jgi:hypothetical protein